MSTPNWKYLPTHLFEYISTYVDTISANGLLVVSCRKTCPIEPYDIIRWIKQGNNFDMITMNIYSIPPNKIINIISLLKLLLMTYCFQSAGSIAYINWFKTKNIYLDANYISGVINTFNYNQHEQCSHYELDDIMDIYVYHFPYVKGVLFDIDIYDVLNSIFISKHNIYLKIKWVLTVKCNLSRFRNGLFWNFIIDGKQPLISARNEFEDDSDAVRKYNIIIIEYILGEIIQNIKSDLIYWSKFLPHEQHMLDIVNLYSTDSNSINILIEKIKHIFKQYNIRLYEGDIWSRPLDLDDHNSVIELYNIL